MKKRKIIKILAILIILGILGFALFRKFHTPVANGQLSDAQVKSLVTKVSKLINVPDETPVVATIIQADQLIAEQKFYAGSKDGDYLIVFPQNQKAIIYREKENRLINVGPIIVDPTATSTKPAASTSTATSTTDAKRSATSTDTSHDIVNGSSTKKSN